MHDDFDITDYADPQTVRLRFHGTLAGEPVEWDATFVTLACVSARCSFIEVGETGSAGRRLQVGLPVEAIDLPTVRKAVTMIRQWKRLAPGRHEFGPR